MKILYLIAFFFLSSISAQAKNNTHNFYYVKGIEFIDMKPSYRPLSGFYPWNKDPILENKMLNDIQARSETEVQTIPNFYEAHASLHGFANISLYVNTPNDFIKSSKPSVKTKIFYSKVALNQISRRIKNIENKMILTRVWEGNEYIIGMIDITSNSLNEKFITNKNFIEDFHYSKKVKKIKLTGDSDRACEDVRIKNKFIAREIEEIDGVKDLLVKEVVNSSWDTVINKNGNICKVAGVPLGNIPNSIAFDDIPEYYPTYFD